MLYCFYMPNTIESTLSPFVQEFIDKYQEYIAPKPSTETVAKIHVDEAISRLTVLYEKIRKVVDWHEEHLMRRVAVKRILNRRIFLGGRGGEAEPFIFELIKGGHFPNDQIDKNKIRDIQKTINKYSFILKRCVLLPRGSRSIFRDQTIEIAACEVEEKLDPLLYFKMNVLIELMEKMMRGSIRFTGLAKERLLVSGETKNTLIYIAAQQALFHLDEPNILYNLIKKRYPDWLEMDNNALPMLVKTFNPVLGSLRRTIRHPLYNKIYEIAEQADSPFLILGDIVFDNDPVLKEILLSEERLIGLMRKKYYNRLSKLKGRTTRAAIFSTVSIFLSNILVLYLIEIPVAKYIIGKFNPLIQLLDIFVPTMLMFFLTTTIRLPGDNNFKAMIQRVKNIIYNNLSIDQEVDIGPTRSGLIKFLTRTLYFIGFILCFGIMSWFLYKFQFPPFSWLIFYTFNSLIAFAGLKIRKRAKELNILKEKERFITIILDIFALPVIRVGKWLSGRWRKFNIIGIIFNLLIEVPFLSLVDFLEEWRRFVKEKKGDIY